MEKVTKKSDFFNVSRIVLIIITNFMARICFMLTLRASSTKTISHSPFN